MANLDKELGTTGGLAPDPMNWGGRGATRYVVEPLEPNADLRFPWSIPIYDEMRKSDGQVGSLLLAIFEPVLSAKWDLDDAGVRPEVSAFVRSELGLQTAGQARSRRRRHGVVWTEHLREALLALPLGFMPFEQVYEAAPPLPDQEGLGSDLLLHLRKLAPRLPRTVSQIHVGRDGGLTGISQINTVAATVADTEIFIPVDRLVFYCWNKEGADWTGQSILRSIYKNWMIGDRLLRLSPQIVERNGMGVPVVTYDPQHMSKTEAESIGADFRAGAAASLALPIGATVQLMGVTGQTVDPLPQMKYHDEKIAESALAMFKTLGHDSGARSLGDTFVDIFTKGEQAVADYFAHIATEHIIRDLVELNFGADEPYPVLTPGSLAANGDITTSALKELVDSKIIVPDADLEAFLRARNGLPLADPLTSREVTPAPAAGGAPVAFAEGGHAPATLDRVAAMLERVVELRTRPGGGHV